MQRKKPFSSKRKRDDKNFVQIQCELRKVQAMTGCSTKTLDLVLQRLQPFLKGCENVSVFKMKQARAKRQSKIKRQLHGCVGCNNHVFGPANKTTHCPKCTHPRYNLQGAPHEVCWYFPLHEQLQRLLQIPVYRHYLMYEKEHLQFRSADDFMSDVYDSPRWKKVCGEPGNRLTRIVLQLCVDGVPAFTKKNCKHVGSVKPIQYFVANLPPWLRYRVHNMLVHALVPATLKGIAASKYYHWLGTHEMTPLFTHGVDGVRVIVYGNTMDTPGRRELLAMQAVTAFYPCPYCVHSWQPGLRGQTYGGYRRFLPAGSTWRNDRFQFMGLLYQFRDKESRPPPILRNDKNVWSNLFIFSAT